MSIFGYINIKGNEENDIVKKLNETLKITILVSVAVLTLFYISFKIVKSDIERHQYPITLNNDNYKSKFKKYKTI